MLSKECSTVVIIEEQRKRKAYMYNSGIKGTCTTASVWDSTQVSADLSKALREASLRSA